jgi:hypothetical protein
MKTMLRLCSAGLLVLFLQPGVVAQDKEPDFEKKKSYSKSYNVDGNDRITFDNRFGELKINTWEKNEVKVDVSMTAKAWSDERAQEILDRISIQDDQSSNGVSFKTDIDDDNRSWKKGDKNKNRNEQFNINYVVYVPARNPLVAKNEFGSMTIPDYAGEIDVTSKFGSLQAGNLSNAKKIRIEFGNGTIQSITNGQLHIGFSSPVVVNRASGKVDISMEHSGGVKIVVDNNVKEVTVKNNFSTLYLDVPKNISANFNVTTNFGDLDNKSDFAINKEGDDDDDHGPQFRHSYQGKAGNGNVPIKVSSEFGQTVIGHNLEMKVAAKNKDKEKKKTRAI